MSLLRRKGLFESTKVLFLPIAAISPNPDQPRTCFSREGLEALAASCPGVSHPVTLPWRDDALDLATFWRQWLSWQATPAQKAWAFHDALACGLAAMARDCATVRGIDTMVCSGGVLHNRLLAARLTFYLADFTLLFAQQLPAGDGAIAYGQAVIAAARGQAQGIQP